MSGADYMAEEWGLNCSYNSMVSFELSPYGIAKKDIIDFTQTMGEIKATVPFAIVLPSEYACVEVTDIFGKYERGLRREKYMQKLMSDKERRVINHTDDVLGFIFGRDNDKIFGTEGHTIANSRFGDLFDIIYEDAPDGAFKNYVALIDASIDGGFANAKRNAGYNILTTDDLDKLEVEIKAITEQTLPCTVDSLCWLLSGDECGKRYVTVLNNEGNNRNLITGDDIIREADTNVTIRFKEPAELKCIKHGFDAPTVTKKDSKIYVVTIPSAGYAVFEY